MNNLAAEPQGFKFFCEKLVVAEEVFNTAQAQTRFFTGVTLFETPQAAGFLPCALR